MNHTPTPWHVATSKGDTTDIYSLSGIWVAHCTSAAADNAENAAFIVRACNAHDILVELAERVIVHFAGTDAPLADFARTALKLARGE